MQRMEQFNIRIEKKLVEDIDDAVESDPSYGSRSDYIRSVLRERVREDRLRRMDETALKLKELMIARGAKPGLITRAEKKKVADELFKSLGRK